MKKKIITITLIILLVVFFIIRQKKMKTKECKNKYHFSQSSLSRLNGVNPLLVNIMKEAVKCSPYDFGIAWMGGFRTAKQQNILYKKNSPKKWITSKDGYIKKSRHQSGMAVDIMCYKNGKITWSNRVFTEVAKHILKVAKEKFNTNLVWGGNWNKKDYGHFEINRF